MLPRVVIVAIVLSVILAVGLLLALAGCCCRQKARPPTAAAAEAAAAAKANRTKDRKQMGDHGSKISRSWKSFLGLLTYTDRTIDQCFLSSPLPNDGQSHWNGVLIPIFPPAHLNSKSMIVERYAAPPKYYTPSSSFVKNQLARSNSSSSSTDQVTYNKVSFVLQKSLSCDLNK